MIIKVYSSPIKNKRFRAEVQTKDGIKKIDFGLQGAYTYLDGADDKIRENYWKRHLGNATEKRLISNLIPSSSLLSAYLIWGKSRDIQQNINALNRLWKD